MKRLLFVLFLVAACLSYGQRDTVLRSTKLSPYVSTGGSFTYIPNMVQDFGGYRHHEFIWRYYVKFSFWKRFHQGVDFQYVRTQSVIDGSENHYLFGVMVQYDFLKLATNRLYGEVGYYRGNYCSCGNGNNQPFKKEGLLYPSVGLGTEIRLRRSLYLDVAFSHKYVSTVKKSEYRYRSFNIYLIGLNYHFLQKDDDKSP